VALWWTALHKQCILTPKTKYNEWRLCVLEEPFEPPRAKR